MTHSPTDWGELSRLFVAMRELEPGARESYLAEQSVEETVAREVMQLLEADDRRGGFLSPLDAGVRDAARASTPPALLPGAMVGRYEIIDPIAKGGMGEVYRGRRADAEFEKTVALKIIRRGVATEEMCRRFQAERQTLASLDHPNIARLLDGGSTPEGLPYFVMEYIEGAPVTEYCEGRRLGLRERLRLFVQVCDAVRYAHRRLVVHRDLKPSNILVTAEGEPKLLDFGIARLLDEPAEGAPATQTRAAAMTPEYASPEQIRGEPVSTATDVYSLGVVLYELLAGRRPFTAAAASRYELERMICEREADPPSTTRLDSPPRRAGEHIATPSRRQLKGDLDSIILMALRKDPARRYGSVGHLMDDILRHLDGLPVLARRDTLAYRARKFVRRNRPQVALGVVAMLAVLVALASVSVGLARSRSAVIAAEEAQRDTQGVAEYFEAMLASASPFARGRRVSVQDLLDDAERLIDERLIDSPAVEARVRLGLGRTYRELLLSEQAVHHLELALEQFRVRAPDELMLAECLSLLASSRSEIAITRGGPADGLVAMQQEALSIRRARLGHEHPLVAQSLRELGLAHWAEGPSGSLAGSAVPLFRESIGLYERLGMPRSEGAAESHLLLAHALNEQGLPEEAEAQFRTALELHERIPGVSRQELLSIEALGHFYRSRGEPERAIGVFRLYTQRAPRDIVLWSTKNAMWQITLLNLELGRMDEARRALEEVLVAECEMLRFDNPGFDEQLGGLMSGFSERPPAGDPLGALRDTLPVFLAIRAGSPDLIEGTLQVLLTVAFRIGGLQAAAELLDAGEEALAASLPPEHHLHQIIAAHRQRLRAQDPASSS